MTAKKKSTPKKKSTAKKARTPKAPAVTVTNHRFPPDTEVGFYRPQTVEVERHGSFAPFGKPEATAKVKADGTLEVRGLDKGPWAAAGQVGGEYLFVQFSVK